MPVTARIGMVASQPFTSHCMKLSARRVNLFTGVSVCVVLVNSEGPGLWCASRPAGARRRARYQTRLVRESARRARTAAYLHRYMSRTAHQKSLDAAPKLTHVEIARPLIGPAGPPQGNRAGGAPPARSLLTPSPTSAVGEP